VAPLRFIIAQMGKFITNIFAVLLAVWGNGAQAQEMSALARLDPGASFIRDEGARGLAIDLHLSQAVPYRVFTLDQPMRLVLDFREVNWSGVQPDALLNEDQASQWASAVRFGVFRPGWSRMVVDLAAPMQVLRVGMVTDQETGEAVVQLRLQKVAPDLFQAKTGAPDIGIWAKPAIITPEQPLARQIGDRPLVVVLDPGHGGIDPGAQQGGETEAHLMLIFARELKELLIRSGDFEVVLTRDADVFVPLERRVSIARAAGADVFISLHADALAAGRASGATIYTLAESASDLASQTLAERHDRNDLLAGVDLSNQDDVIADILMDLARLHTAPRADLLADKLVAGLRQTVERMHKRPRQSAAFSVLKSPDIPSVLIELGFLSDPVDRKNLTTPAWRAKAAEGIRDALESWAQKDAAKARLLRQ